MTDVDEFTLNLVSNEELLAINQDALGASAVLECDDNGLRTYRRPLSANRTAYAFVNLADKPRTLQYAFPRPASLRDPIAMHTLPETDAVTIPLSPHATRILIADA